MNMIRNRWFIIGLFLAVIAVSWYFIPGLRVTYSFRDFYIDNDPDLAFFQDFSKKFESDEHVVMIGIQHDQSVFDQEFLNKFDQFTAACSKLPLIRQAYSLTTLNDLAKTPFGFSKIPFLHVDDSLRYQSDSVRIFSDPRIPGWLISEDARVMAVVLNVSEDAAEKEKDLLVSSLDSLISQFNFNEAHTAGNIITETRYIRLIKEEMRFNMVLCTLVIIVSLAFFFRSFTGVAISMMTILIAMMIFYGLLAIFHRPINVLSTLFPTIIMVVGTSGLVHIYNHYHETLKENISKGQALAKSVKELTIRILMTSLTTAIGFFSLATSSMKPIRYFGIEAGAGVMLTFVVAITLFPCVLYFLPKRIISEKMLFRSGFWTVLLRNINEIANKFPRTVLMITILLCGISIWGILNIDKNNFILGNFSGKSEIRKDVAFFEDRLSGIRIMNIAVLPSGGRPVNDMEVLVETDKLQQYLEPLPPVGVLYSPATVYKSLHKIFNGGSGEYYRLPPSGEVIKQYDKTFHALLKNELFRFMDDDKKTGVITGRMKDIGSVNAKELQLQIERWISENINPEIVKFRFTGISFLADRSNDYLIRNMFLNLALAFLIVSILMLILFKTLKMLVISLIPNIVPIIIGGMINGISGIVLNGYVAIVYTIGFVIAVDNTIHFLAKFRLQRSLNQPFKTARYESIKATGRAMIMTSAILFFGFLVLVHSDLMGVFSQGVLVSSILLFALLADLFLLPALLSLFYDRKDLK